jgi:hypothetical protein
MNPRPFRSRYGTHYPRPVTAISAQSIQNRSSPANWSSGTAPTAMPQTRSDRVLTRHRAAHL